MAVAAVLGRFHLGLLNAAQYLHRHALQCLPREIAPIEGVFDCEFVWVAGGMGFEKPWLLRPDREGQCCLQAKHCRQPPAGATGRVWERLRRSLMEAAKQFRQSMQFHMRANFTNPFRMASTGLKTITRQAPKLSRCHAARPSRCDRTWVITASGRYRALTGEHSVAQ
jgi:hypothetical protein